MGRDDRSYYRDRSGSSTNPFVWLFSGSVPLANVLGVRVRAHATLIVFAAVTLIFGYEKYYPLGLRIVTMGMWTAFVAMHELAHCFAGRMVGNPSNTAMLWPLGGISSVTNSPRPMASLATALAGPFFNLVLCVIAMTMLARAGHSYSTLPFDLYHPPVQPFAPNFGDPSLYLWWAFAINVILFAVNMLPIYPLDGGQILQSVLWPMVGQFRSMLIATSVGMIGSAGLGIVSLAMATKVGWIFAALSVWMFYESYQRRMALRESGPEDWTDSLDFDGGLYASPPQPKRRRLSQGAIRKARKIAMREKAQRDHLDAILAKVGAHGLQSLTWLERRTLRKATARHRRQETELSRFQ